MADDLDDEWWVDQKKADDEEVSKESPDSDSDHGQKNGQHEDKKIKEKQAIKPESNKKKKKKEKQKQTNKEIQKKGKVESTKRKQEEVPNEGATEEPPAKKKRKRKLKSEELAAKPVTPLTPETLVDTLTKHYKDKLSTVEWDELSLDTTKNFCECNDMTHNPVSYLKTVFPKWAKAVEKGGSQAKKGAGDEALKPGSPLILIITQAALRATQLNREITDFKGKDCKTAKLFAKHFKLNEQVKFLSKNTVHLGIGTPSRIQALLENGGLHLDSVRRIVLDWSWRDVKLRRMVEIPELRTQLFDLLRKFIIPRLKDSTCKLGLM